MNTFITETTEFGEVPIDIYQKLSNDRILFLCNRIDDKLATDVTATLLLKDNENQEEPITLFINSEGGDIRNVLMIYDMMCMISAPIRTVCIGAAMDEAAILLAAGTVGERLVTKNSVISVSQLIHDWMDFSDLTNAKTNLKQAEDDNKRMMEVIAKKCGKTLKQVMEDFERRVFMNASKAVKYGLVDKVVTFNK